MNREPKQPAMAWLRPTVVAALAFGVAAAAAPTVHAAAPAQIEGSWFFNGGEVLVEATGPGTFKGTVVRETRFATCPHQVGEVMWDLRATPHPAIFEGGHNWLRDSDCSIVSPRRYRTCTRKRR